MPWLGKDFPKWDVYHWVYHWDRTMSNPMIYPMKWIYPMISVDLSQPRYIIGYIIYELLDFEDFHVEKQPNQFRDLNN